ncbi:Aldo/keto reductase [Xylariaceae sp. FL1272]|nr:Aldo/keto reductase [Xylariaceae sp. FL1272]
MATTVVCGKHITQNGLGLSRLVIPPLSVTAEEAIQVLKAALQAGVHVWNAADFYGTPEYNSLHLMNLYFTKYPEDANRVLLMVKGGIKDMKTYSVDCSAEGMRRSFESVNKILDGKKTIDVFGPARIDPKVPIEDTIKGLLALKNEGKIGGIQLSEVNADTIKRASKVAKIDMVEQEVSLWATAIFDNGVAQTCAELQIPIVAHTPLGGGMLTGKYKSTDDLEPNNHHRHFPRYQGENFKKNLDLVEKVKELAETKGCNATQLALSWIKTQSRRPNMPFFIPIAGSTSQTRVAENATQVELMDADLNAIDDILANFEVSGTRYPESGMKLTQF